MASQIGVTRVYSDPNEVTDIHKVRCPLCKVEAVPRGISESGTHELGNIETHCPNCGHVHGRENH